MPMELRDGPSRGLWQVVRLDSEIDKDVDRWTTSTFLFPFERKGFATGEQRGALVLIRTNGDYNLEVNLGPYEVAGLNVGCPMTFSSTSSI